MNQSIEVWHAWNVQIVQLNKDKERYSDIKYFTRKLTAIGCGGGG